MQPAWWIQTLLLWCNSANHWTTPPTERKESALSKLTVSLSVSSSCNHCQCGCCLCFIASWISRSDRRHACTCDFSMDLMCSVQKILRDLAPCNIVLFAKMKFKFKGSSGHDRNASVWVREQPLTERCKVVSHAGSKAAQQEEMMFLSQGFSLFVFSLHEKNPHTSMHCLQITLHVHLYLFPLWLSVFPCSIIKPCEALAVGQNLKNHICDPILISWIMFCIFLFFFYQHLFWFIKTDVEHFHLSAAALTVLISFCIY